MEKAILESVVQTLIYIEEASEEVLASECNYKAETCVIEIKAMSTTLRTVLEHFNSVRCGE
ncbi:hypothetical protein CHF27_011115 [Romboutsia maritimum]|uniref:Uncharacterized protein n=1 Tax=Romboutsia maritimum TaxID=2020948 RepID=A0A371IQX2_9FIRM|nr:hypothetical protein [Romboutsia maritimum]RDY22863.1 hypothetical protein CHF27_011115 [Romboutsia maritimum]